MLTLSGLRGDLLSFEILAWLNILPAIFRRVPGSSIPVQMEPQRSPWRKTVSILWVTFLLCRMVVLLMSFWNYGMNSDWENKEHVLEVLVAAAAYFSAIFFLLLLFYKHPQLNSLLFNEILRIIST
jgi:hypothetical protein